MREIVAVVAGLLALAAIDYGIFQRERLISDGRVVLLELIPVDPRSLMQGDYMALRFKAANDAFPRGTAKDLKDGRLVVALDERNVGTFKRFEDGSPLAANEVLLRYRIRNDQPKFATNAFFFQEGHANRYGGARYGDFRVSADGDLILTGMRGAKFELLGAPKEGER